MPDIDDPFKPSDATVLRPRPGAGRRGIGDPPSGVQQIPPRPASSAYAEPIPAAARDLLGAGLNPLVQAASPLLMLAGQLRGSLSAPEVGDLRRHALEEIRRFEERARVSGDSAWGKRLRARRSQLEREREQAVEKPQSEASGIRLAFTSAGSQADIALSLSATQTGEAVEAISE